MADRTMPCASGAVPYSGSTRTRRCGRARRYDAANARYAATVARSDSAHDSTCDADSRGMVSVVSVVSVCSLLLLLLLVAAVTAAFFLPPGCLWWLW